LNLWSFLALQMYQRVVRKVSICSSVMRSWSSCDKIFWTPSCSYGKAEVQRDGFAENQTARGNVQRKTKWLSFSSKPQVVQFLLILLECFPALSRVARVRLISNFHVFASMSFWGWTLLEERRFWHLAGVVGSSPKNLENWKHLRQYMYLWQPASIW